MPPSPPNAPPAPPNNAGTCKGSGFVWVASHPLDASGHCAAASTCGKAVVNAMTYALTKPATAKAMSGIIVVMGAASGQAKVSFDAYWAAAKKAVPAVGVNTVTYLSDVTAIKAATIINSKLLYIAGSA